MNLKVFIKLSAIICLIVSGCISFPTSSFAWIISLDNSAFTMPSWFNANAYEIKRGSFSIRLYTNKAPNLTDTQCSNYYCSRYNRWGVCTKRCRNCTRYYKDDPDIGEIFLDDVYYFSYFTPHYSYGGFDKEVFNHSSWWVPYYTRYYYNYSGYAGFWSGSTELRSSTLQRLEDLRTLHLNIHRYTGTYPRISSAYLNLDIQTRPMPQNKSSNVVPEASNIILFSLGLFLFEIYRRFYCFSF